MLGVHLFLNAAALRAGSVFMTDKELKKLNKRELLELLAAMREEIDALRVENEALRRTIAGGEGDLLSATAMRVKKLYEERFGADTPAKPKTEGAEE